MRVLLADDHAIVRRGLRGLLEEEGLTVVGEAADGHEALRLCEELTPAVLILDIAMPRLNGIEVVKVDGLIDPPTASLVRDAINRANRHRSTMVVLQLDSGCSVVNSLPSIP